MSKKPLTRLRANAVAAAALSTSTFWPFRAAFTLMTNWSGDTPFATRARISSNCPGWLNSDWALLVVKNTALEPSDASDEPNVASPTMVNGSVGFCVATLIVSPSVNLADFMTPRSTTISLSAAGARPLNSL